MLEAEILYEGWDVFIAFACIYPWNGSNLYGFPGGIDRLSKDHLAKAILIKYACKNMPMLSQAGNFTFKNMLL